MAVTLDSFLEKYPSFLDLDPLLVENELASVLIETCGYIGFKTPEESDLGVELHLAHNLTAFIRSGSGAVTGSQAGGQSIKKLKSRQDEIEYHGQSGGSNNLFNLNSTYFGSRLQRLIDNNYCGGFIC